MSLAALTWYGARICLVAMFPFSAIDKIWHWRNSLVQTQSSGLPGGKAMLVAAILIEAFTPLMIVVDWHDRIGAFVLAGFCVVTAFVYHPFWRGPDFFSSADDSKAREHFWQFLKNFGLAGGLGLIIVNGAMTSPREVLAHPFSSSPRP